MRVFGRCGLGRAVAAGSLFAGLGAMAVVAQQPDNAQVVRQIDAAVKARLDGIAGYTVTEHYAVYRNADEAHPVAEMTEKTTYREETGKSYAILSQSGSEIIRNMVLGSILDHEKQINLPGTREGAWFTSANYEMKLRSGETVQVYGKDCYVLDISPRRKSPNLLEGTLWVDAKDGSIAQVEGKGSKSFSFVTGPTQLMREYAKVSGFSQATHARAESDSFLFGKTVVKIDYLDYQVDLRAGH